MNLSSDELRDMLVNPFYAIDFAEGLFTEKPTIAKEDWVLTNAKNIADESGAVWLMSLLDVLSAKPRREKPSNDPSLAVSISSKLQGEHVPLVTREQWIEANINEMKELGVEQWLWRLLNVLEIGGSTDL